MKIRTTLINLFMLTLALVMMQTAIAATPEGAEELYITVGPPTKPDDSEHVISVRYRLDDELKYSSNGYLVVRGPNRKTAHDMYTMAEDIVTALVSGIDYTPKDFRGAAVELVEKEDGSKSDQIRLFNIAGGSLNEVSIIDYTGQKQVLALPQGKTYATANVVVGMDVMGSGEGGSVEFTIDDGDTLSMDTAGQSGDAIEAKIMEHLSKAGMEVTTSDESLTIDSREKDNIMTGRPYFDGTEIRLPAMNANSFTISVNDPGLGVVSKFLFPDENAGFTGGPYITVALIVAFLLFISKDAILNLVKKKQPKQA